MLTVAGLYVLGRRLGGRPLAQAFGFAYLLYPFPALSLLAQTNDALVAALCVWTIVVATERPAARGLLVAAAALTKFLPAVLALQFLTVRRGRWRYALALVAALAAMLAWPLVTSGPARFFDSTFGYQLIQRGGGVQFSIWTYLPHLAVAGRAVLATVLVLLALSPLLRGPVPGARQQAALSAALLIGAQLLLGYWFYSYLTWCYPLVVVAVIRADRVLVAEQGADDEQGHQDQAEHDEAAARSGLPVPGDAVVRGLDIAVGRTRAISVPAQEAAHHQHDRRYAQSG